jgi:hypothetical protein
MLIEQLVQLATKHRIVDAKKTHILLEVHLMAELNPTGVAALPPLRDFLLSF